MKRIGLLLMLGLGAQGCDARGTVNGGHPARTTEAESFLLRRFGKDMGLAVFPQSQTVTAPDSVRLLITLWNGGDPVDLRNDIELYHFDIIDSGGTRLEARIPDYMEWNLEEPNLTLARGGVVGLNVNLQCVEQPYIAHVKRGECMKRFAFAPGVEYRVVVRYEQIRVTEAGMAPPFRLQLTSDTARVTYRTK